MTNLSDSPLASTGREFTISRTFRAPRTLVFQAFSEKERLAQWWGPKGFTMQSATLDFRPGGVFHYGMASPGGQVMWGKFLYREIVPPERIVFVNSFSDADGNTTRSPFSPTWPLEVLNTVTLSEQDGKTIISVVGGPINATDEEVRTFVDSIPSMEQGFAGTWDRLEEYLEGVQTGEQS